uniref:Uncharacterized protein n=1 Tax=Klebsiella pneumoniae TaxID=573 RepID=A0A223DQJ1_KLEPN|nr:Hypothetical protein [Klebsiella pneumoniae]
MSGLNERNLLPYTLPLQPLKVAHIYLNVTLGAFRGYASKTALVLHIELLRISPLRASILAQNPCLLTRCCCPRSFAYGSHSQYRSPG